MFLNSTAELFQPGHEHRVGRIVLSCVSFVAHHLGRSTGFAHASEPIFLERPHRIDEYFSGRGDIADVAQNLAKFATVRGAIATRILLMFRDKFRGDHLVDDFLAPFVKIPEPVFGPISIFRGVCERHQFHPCFDGQDAMRGR